MIHCPLGRKRNYQNYFNQKQIIYTVCDETLELSSNCTQISKKIQRAYITNLSSESDGSMRLIATGVPRQ